jgi:uncharacterized membrane protein
MSLKAFSRGVLAVFVIVTGVLHFARPEPFVAIVPDYLPYPLALVYVSGFFEILGGVGLFIPHLRRAAAWGLIALFIAVFPANIHMAIHKLPFMGEVHPIANWVRLPFQFVLIAWAFWLTKEDA